MAYVDFIDLGPRAYRDARAAVAQAQTARARIEVSLSRAYSAAEQRTIVEDDTNGLERLLAAVIAARKFISEMAGVPL